MSVIAAKRGQLLGASAAAAYLGISIHQFRRLVGAHKVAFQANDRGRFLGAYERDLDEWQARTRVPAQTTEAIERRVRTAAVDAAMDTLLGDAPRVFSRPGSHDGRSQEGRN